jgi:surfactin family lipopeptide synthetase A
MKSDIDNSTMALSVSERHQLLVEWNNTQADYPEQKCIHQLFEAQVERTPNAIAVLFEEEQLTYDELNRRANQLAHHLQSLGVLPDILVGICAERSIEMLIGLLAILKAGGAYVPLDPSYPKERLAFMLADAGVPILLTQKKLVEKLPEHQAQIVCLETDWQRTSDHNPTSPVIPSHLAYVIYTSGSTGQPKGVMMKHAALSNLIAWQIQQSMLSDNAKTLQFAPISFDVSCQELFSTWGAGGTLVLISERLRKDSMMLLRFITEQDIERLFLPFVALQQLSEVVLNALGTVPTTLREIITAGEALQITPAIAHFFKSLPYARLHNQYGPSESHVVTAFSLTGSVTEWPSLPPIGRPIANAQIYLLDQNRQPVAIEQTGEIYIAGVSLANGYLNRPELTKEKFITHDNLIPHQAIRLYKTGDLGRYQPDGNLVFLGRIDHQVKIRGYRIELSEIEVMLAQHAGVEEAVVIMWEVQQTDKRLVAYIIPNRKAAPTPTELHQYLKEQLADYMVPATFVMLEKLPLTPSGKIDRKALATEVSFDRSIKGERVAPRTSIEKRLTSIWISVLEIEEIGIADNFFELGGHSLLVLQVISKVQEIFNVALSISSLFESPTIAELAQQIEMTRKNESHATPILPIPHRQDNLPLSFFQDQLWFLAQLNPKLPFYNESATIHMPHTLNVAALEKSLNEILKRHEALRTHFVNVAGQGVQRVMPPSKHKLPVLDLSALPFEQAIAKAQELATEEAKQDFDLSQDILLRTRLVRLEKSQYRLFLTLHHLIIDGLSLVIFLKELAALYKAFSTGQASSLPKLPIQYADFAHWQRQHFSAERLEKQRAYWKSRLSDHLPILQLPTDHPRPITPTFRGGKQYFVLSKTLTDALKRLSQEEGVTLFMSLLAAFKILLYRYTGQEDIIVGTVVAVRHQPELQHLIGYFLNTLLLRTDLSGRPSFRQFVARVREVTLEAMAHKDLPFVKLLESLEIQRNIGQNPLFQVALTLEPSMPEIDLGWTLTQSEIDNETTKFDLYLGLEEKPEGITGRIEYSTDLFEAATIERMIGHFQILLEAIVTNSGERISELPLLTEGERHQLLVEWNDTQTDYPQDKCINQLFEEQVKQRPNQIALLFENQQLTYQELNCKANQLAHYLRTLGVKPEVLVGICVERSCEMIVGLLGILKAGGVYVPLDPVYPAERLAFMLEDANVAVLLTEQKLMDKLPSSQADLLCLDSDWEMISQYSDKNPLNQLKAENLAYVIYTSGSIGKPKGVAVPHRAVTRLVLNTNYIQLRSSDKIGQSSNVSFDAATLEIWGALLSGARLVGMSTDILLSPQKFLSYLREQEITVLCLITALFNHLAREVPVIFNEMRYVVFGGEAVEPRWVAEILKHGPPQQLLHVYGPTENTTISSCYLVENVSENASTIPIGCPISNTQLFVLDKHLQLTPIGVPGELYLGGAGVARGYLNRPQLTAEKFIKNPFNNDLKNRLYKTGDLVRYLPDGNLEFLGRIDNQVKMRGFRIELGEIETRLAQHPDIQQVAVLAQEKQADDKRLVAYLVPNKSAITPTAISLRQFLKEKLPDYMIPSAFVFLESMPLTPNGKIDRRALFQLSVISYQLSEKTFVAPRDVLEWQLAQIWEKVLDVNPVGVQDNFFELGGHSLLAVRLMAEIQQQFGKNLSISILFQGATIEELAKLIRQQSDIASWNPVVTLQSQGSKRPFFCMPGSGGHVIYFHHLASHFGTERPFYALQARGLDGHSAPLTCVEDIAAYYLDAIRAIQAQGPYLLGGHSFGGLVAFEMAQQLQRQGQEVAMLAILDLPALHPERSPIKLDWNDAKWMATIAYIFESLSGKTLGLCEADFQALDAEAQLTLLSARLESANLLPKETEINEVRRLIQVIQADEIAFLQYVPSAAYPNRITLFKTSDIYQDELGILEDIPNDSAWGWGRLSTQPVEVLKVPGTHTTILTEPHVQVLADKLKKCLDKLS